jgi:VanZ family protein
VADDIRPAAPALRPLRFASLWIWLGVALVLATLVVCLLPNVRGPLPSLNGMDKVDHAIAYFVLSAWFGSIVTRRAWLHVIVAALLLGAGIEVAQSLMNIGREASIWDFAADAFGVALGLGFLRLTGDAWLARIEQWLQPN